MKKTMLIGAILSALIACGDETAETYARLAAHSNFWVSSNFKEEFEGRVCIYMMQLKKTEAVCRGVERWMLDVLGYSEGDSLVDRKKRIWAKKGLLWLVATDGLCDTTRIGEGIVDYAGHLHNVEESAAVLVAAANAARGFRPGLRASTDEERLLDAAHDVRESMLPRIGQYWPVYSRRKQGRMPLKHRREGASHRSGGAHRLRRLASDNRQRINDLVAYPDRLEKQQQSDYTVYLPPNGRLQGK